MRHQATQRKEKEAVVTTTTAATIVTIRVAKVYTTTATSSTKPGQKAEENKIPHRTTARKIWLAFKHS
uniref:Uncharacterized protein n=1 Tax=Octopus bimaculoides TaxID=37653 RepID=A0A0L8HI99_OCTBM